MQRHKSKSRSIINYREAGLLVFFAGAFQSAVAQFTELFIQDVVAVEERQNGRTALFDSASCALQSLIVAE